MSLRKYLIILTLATAICWVAWVFVLYFIDPEAAPLLGLILFYVSLFLSLTGTFSLLGFFVRVWFLKEEMIFRHIGVSFRQSLLFAFLIIAALLLQGMRFFTWWNAVLFILVLSALEFFFLTRSAHYRQ